MLTTMLVVVTWLQGGPILHTQLLASPRACQQAAQAAVQMIEQQARTNLTGPHGVLSVEYKPQNQDWRLSTGGIGREVARLRCLPAGVAPP